VTGRRHKIKPKLCQAIFINGTFALSGRIILPFTQLGVVIIPLKHDLDTRKAQQAIMEAFSI